MRARLTLSVLGQSILLGILIVSWTSLADNGGISYPIVLAAPTSQAHFDYVVIVAMHNASAQRVYGNSALPYLNSLANTHGYATGYAAVWAKVGLPNYLALVGGSTFGATTNCYPTECPVSAESIVDRIERAGLTWKAWAEDYPVSKGCSTLPRNAEYSASHFPFVYFHNIINNSTRCNNLLQANSAIVASPGTETDDLFIKSLSSSSTAANFMWLTPNQCAAADHCSLSTTDTYLSKLVPSILNSNIFTTQKAALFVTFAEGEALVTSPTDYVSAIWAGPAAKTSFRSSSPYNHYSFLKTLETAWGLSSLTSNDGGASSMSEFFNLQAGFTYTPSAPAASRPVSFTGTGTGGSTPYTFAWTFGDGATGTGNPVSHTYASQASYSVKMKVTDSKGATVTITNTVDVLPTPPALTADFTTTPSSPEVGLSTSFTASQNGGTAPYMYSWVFGDGSPTASGSPVNHTYTAPGSYTVTLTVGDADGLSATASHTVSVAAGLAIVSVTGTPNPSEEGVPVSFSATTSGGAATKTFKWDFGDGPSTASGNPATHTYATSGTRTVTVTVTDGNGVTVTGTVSETVNARLVVTPTASTSQAVVDQTINFDSHIVGGVSPVSCNWTFGDGSIATGCTVTHTYSSAGNFTATVTATDAVGVTVTGSVSVPVTDVCSTSFTWNPSSPEGGQLATFTATTTSNCVPPVSFTWNFGDGNTGSGNPASNTYSNAGGTFTIMVTATDADGVTATNHSTLTVAPRLTVDFDASPSAPEGGQTVTFTATTTGGIGSKTCSWSFGDGGTANGCTATHTYTNTGGTFAVQVTATDGNVITAVASHNLLVAPRLSTTLQATPNPAAVGASVTLTVATAGGVSPFTCSSWNYGDGSTSTSTNCTKTHTYSTAGTFNATVTVTDSNSIKATGSVVVVVTLTCNVAFTYSPTSPEGGVPVTFTTTTVNCVSPVTFAWDFGDGTTGSGSSATHTYSDSGGTLRVALTAVDAEAYQSTSSQTITVATRLAVSFTASPSTPEGGQAMTFTASTTGGVGTKTCSWTFGDGSQAAGCSATHTYNNAGGTFTAVLNATDGNAVTASSSQTISVAVGLAVTFTVDPATPEGGQVVAFTATPTGGVGSASCSWIFGDGNTANTCAATHTYANTGGTFTVKVKATDDNAVTVTSSQGLRIASRLAVSFSLAPSAPEGGQTVTFQAVSTGGVGNVTYSWSFGDGFNGTSNPANNTYATAGGTFTVIVSATDGNAVTAVFSKSVLIAPRLMVSFTTGPTAPEGGQTVTFAATTTGGVGTAICSWNFGDGTTATGCTGAHVYTNTGGTFTVNVNATDSNAITATSSLSLNIAPRLSSADFARSPLSPEVGLVVTFTGGQTAGVGPFAYSWNFGDGSSTATGSPVNHTYTASGSYTVALTVADGNGVTATVAKTVSVALRLAVSFTFSPATPEVGQTVTFAAAATGGVGTVAYSWDFGDGSPASSGSLATHVYANAGGTFTVSVSASDVNAVTVTTSRSLTVAPRLSVDFSFSPANPTGGQTLVFTATTSGGVGTKTCNWSFGDGGTATGCTATHTYAVAGGTFNVAVTASDTNSMAATAFRILAVAPHLSGTDFTFTPVWPEDGVIVSFTAVPSGGVSPYTYSWDFGDGSPTSNNSPAQHAYATSGTFTVTLTVTDAHGVTASKTHVISVAGDNTPPVFTSLPIFDSVTAGQPLTFAVVASDPEGGPVSIVAGGLPASANFDPASGKFSWTPTADQVGNHTITFTATDGVTPPKRASQSVVIEVKPGPRMYTFLGVSLDEGVLIGLAVTGLVTTLATAFLLAVKGTGDSSRTDSEDDYEDMPSWQSDATADRDESLLPYMEES